MAKDRMSKDKVEYWFEMLCRKLGKLIAKDYNEVGKWKLDYYLGRVNIEEINSASGGVTHPFGPDRRTMQGMYDILRFACEALEISQKKPLVSREDQIFADAVQGLMEYNPELAVPELLASVRTRVIVPDTGNEQADYETTKRLVEREIQRVIDEAGGH